MVPFRIKTGRPLDKKISSQLKSSKKFNTHTQSSTRYRKYMVAVVIIAVAVIKESPLGIVDSFP